MTDYYKSLYNLQDSVFEVTSNSFFYLTGGTAINRFYSNVRYSDDLDFFVNNVSTYEFKESVKDILDNFKEIKLNYKLITNTRDFIRVIAIKNDIKLQIDFVNDKIYRRYKESIIDNVKVDNLLEIASNKISAFQGRDEAKDISDLITLNELNVDWIEAFDISKKKDEFNYDYLSYKFSSINPSILNSINYISSEKHKKQSENFYITIEKIRDVIFNSEGNL